MGGSVGSIASDAYHGAFLNPVKSAANIISNPTSKSAWMAGLKDTTNPDPSGLLPSSVDSVLTKVAPYALSLIPGVGPLVGAAYAGANSYGNNGKIAPALINAAGSYASTSGLGSQLGGALGASGAGASALGNGIIGAGTAAATGGGVKGALEGGAIGAAGGYLGNGGLSDFSDSLSNFSNDSGLSSLWGGTAQPTSNLNDLYGGVTNAAPATADIASAAATPGPAASGDFLSGALPGGGNITSQGGGAGGGGFDIANAGEGSSLPSSSGVGGGVASPTNGNILSNPFDGAYQPPAGSFGSNPASPLASTGGSVNSAPTSILGKLFGGNSGVGTTLGGSLLSGLLRSGLTAAGTNTNQAGYQGINTAAQQAGANYQPFLQSGTAANNTLADLYGSNGQEAAQAASTDWQNTPGYQFALQQGQNLVNSDAAAKGQLLSGNNQQALQKFGTGLAAQQYQQYIQNLQNQAAQGISAAGGVGTAGLTGANALAQAGQAKANNQNTLVGGVANSMFPQYNPAAGQQNQGLLSLFQ